MYHMVTGKNPQEPPYKILPIREVNPMLSSGLEAIIQKCTQPNPEDRYQSCKELIYALEHYTELDDTYVKSNKKKVSLFAATAALTLLFAGVAIGGRVGVRKIQMENYSAYIDLYIDASNNTDENGETPLELKDGLDVVVNRVKNGYSNVDKNNMVDEKDEDYGELAEYYGSISQILSNTNVNVSDLLENVNGFAQYNMNRLNNTNRQKFINYQTVGTIYTTYLLREDEEDYDDYDEDEDDITSVLTSGGIEAGKLSQSDVHGTLDENLTSVLKADMMPGAEEEKPTIADVRIKVLYDATVVHTDESL